MNPAGERMAVMQITLTVSDEIVREAGDRGLPVIDFVESLVDRGFLAVKERPVLSSAIERIRALRTAPPGNKD
jgi:hypothetical protein